MSIKIKLYYSKALDLELIERNIEIWLRRVSLQVCFKTAKNYTRPYEAILDTGAPVSILPPAIWQEIDREILGEYKIQGIVPKKDSYVTVKIANIACVLMDANNITENLKIKAYLSLDDKVPLIIGFENIISKSKLYLNPKDGEGFIEI